MRVFGTIFMQQETKCPFLKLVQKFTIDLNRQKSHKKGHETSVSHLKNYFLFSSILVLARNIVFNVKNIFQCSINAKYFLKDKCSKDSYNLFDYSKAFNQYIESKKQDGSYRKFRNVSRMVDKPSFAICKEKNKTKKVSVWCSNDYLGLSRHPRVIHAATKALSVCGNGAGGTRNIAGTNNIHTVVEDALSKLHRKENSLLFNSCYLANETTLSTLGKLLPNCVILSDKKNHASMIEGISHSRCKKIIFRHNDTKHLEQLLKDLPSHIPKIVAFESIYSMDGNISELEEIVKISKKYGAITFCDEVHAIGLYGQYGSGIAAMKGLSNQVDIISGTLGKSIGAIGGYICGTKELVDFIRSFGKGFIFTTSLPPAVLHGALESIKIISSNEGRLMRQRLKINVKYFKLCMLKIGIPMHDNHSHIIKIKVGDPKLCESIANILLSEYNIYVQPINYPTVMRGDEMLRIVPTCYHTKEMIINFTQCLKKIWEERLGHTVPIYCTEKKVCTRCKHNELENLISIINCPFRNTNLHYQQLKL